MGGISLATQTGAASMLPLQLWIAILSRVAIAAGVIGAFFWFCDVIGDRREAKVRAEYDQALAETNQDIEASSEVQQKVAAAARLVREKAVRHALSRSGQCKMTAQDAADLNRIKAR